MARNRDVEPSPEEAAVAQGLEPSDPALEPVEGGDSEQHEAPTLDEALSGDVGELARQHTEAALEANQNLYDRKNPWPDPDVVNAIREQNPNSIGPTHTRRTDGFLQPLTDPRSKRDPAIINRSHPFKVPIDINVLSVKTGTPLKPGPNGWLPTSDDDGQAVAAVFMEGGGLCPVYMIATLETYVRQFESGKRYSVGEVDDRGGLTFEGPNDSAPYMAVSDSQIIMDMTRHG